MAAPGSGCGSRRRLPRCRCGPTGAAAGPAAQVRSDLHAVEAPLLRSGRTRASEAASANSGSWVRVGVGVGVGVGRAGRFRGLGIDCGKCIASIARAQENRPRAWVAGNSAWSDTLCNSGSAPGTAQLRERHLRPSPAAPPFPPQGAANRTEILAVTPRSHARSTSDGVPIEVGGPEAVPSHTGQRNRIYPIDSTARHTE